MPPIDARNFFMHDTCMATKTISIELDAYECLVRARRDPKESFSNVVRRAHWDDAPPMAGDILSRLDSLAEANPGILLDTEALDRIDARVRSTRPTSRWEQS